MVCRCLQGSVLLSFYLKVTKLNMWTYKGPSDESLFLHEGLCKNHTPSLHYFIKKTLLQNISLVVTLVTFSYVVTLHFSGFVLVGFQKCSVV